MEYSEERKRAIRAGILKARENHPWTNKGFKFNEEQRKHLSDACLGRIPWNKGLKGDVYKEHFAKIGRPKGAKDSVPRPRRTMAYRRRASEIHKAGPLLQVAINNLKSINRFYQTEEGRRILRQRSLLAKVPNQDTSIEILAQESLAKAGIAFVTHPIVEGICRPDIKFLDSRILVFIDGCYWHGCPIHNPWPKGREIRTIERDVRQRPRLRSLGYEVVSVWEHEIRADHDILLRMITRLRQTPTKEVMKLG